MGNTASAWKTSIELKRANSGLVAGLFFRKKRVFNELLHPRGSDGRFITKGGDVKWREKSRGGLWMRGTVTDIPGDGNIKVTTRDGVIHTKKPKELINAPKAIARLDPTKWKKTRGQAGSNPAAFFEDDNKDEWYVKDLATPGHVNAEVLGHRLYELAGAPVPEVTRSPDGRKFMTKIENSDDFHDLTAAEKDEAKKAARRHFLTDAWLANWDAPVNDNIRFNEDGEAMRIDTGGALHYRARGGLKGHLFGKNVGELKTLRDPNMNYGGSVMYAGLTPDEERDNLDRILAIHPDVIRETVKAEGVPSHVADTLIERREFLANHYGVELPEETTAAKLDLKQQIAKKAVKQGTPDTVAKTKTSAKTSTVQDKAVPMAVGAPAWVKTSDLQQGGGDRWTVKSISADKTSATLQSVTQPGKTIELNNDQFTLLRSNFTAVGSSYKSGEIPLIGDRVKVQRTRGKDTNPFDGTIVATYPKYVKVQKDDNSKVVVSQASTSLLHRAAENTGPDHAESAPDDSTDSTPIGADKDALDTLEGGKSVFDEKPVFQGEKFDANSHDWDKEPYPKVFSEIHGREARVVFAKRNISGEIENLVVTTDNDFGATDTIAPNRAYAVGTVDSSGIAQHMQKLAAWRAKARQELNIERIIQNSGDDSDSSLSEFSPHEIFKILSEDMTHEQAKAVPMKQISKDMLTGFDAGEEIKPGDRPFAVTIADKYSNEPSIAVFNRREGKLSLIGANDEAVKSNPHISQAVRAVQAGQDNDIAANRLIMNVASLSQFWQYKGSIKTHDLTDMVGEASANVLGNSEIRFDKEDMDRIYASDGTEYKIDELPKKLGITKTANHAVRVAEFVPTNAIDQEKQPTFVAVSSVLQKGDVKDSKAFIAGYGGEILPIEQWIELPEQQRRIMSLRSNTIEVNRSSDMHIKGDTIELTGRDGTVHHIDDSLLYSGHQTETSLSKHRASIHRGRLLVRKGKAKNEPFSQIYDEYYNNLFDKAKTWRDDINSNDDQGPIAPEVERVIGKVPDQYGQVHSGKTNGPEDALGRANPFSREGFESGKFNDDIFTAMVQNFDDSAGNRTSVRMEDNSVHADPALAYMHNKYDLDANAVKLNPDEFDAYVRQHGTDVLYRGISGEKYVNDFRTGSNFAGYGVFGNGLYTTPDWYTAKSYGGHSDDSITELTERAGNKTLMATNTEKELAAAYKTTGEEHLNNLHDAGLAPSPEELAFNGTYYPDENDLPSVSDVEADITHPNVKKHFETAIGRKALRWNLDNGRKIGDEKRNQAWADENPKEYIGILDEFKRINTLQKFYESQDIELLTVERQEHSNSFEMHFKRDSDNVGDYDYNDSFHVLMSKTAVLDDTLYRNGTLSNDDKPMTFDFRPQIMGLNNKITTRSQDTRNTTFTPSQINYTFRTGNAIEFGAQMLDLKKKLKSADNYKVNNKTLKHANAYIERDGSIITTEDRFNERKAELRDALSAADYKKTYGDDTLTFDGEFPQYIEEMLPAMKSYAKMLYMMDPGRAALILGYDKIQLDATAGTDHRIFTHRGAMIMKRTW